MRFSELQRNLVRMTACTLLLAVGGYLYAPARAQNSDAEPQRAPTATARLTERNQQLRAFFSSASNRLADYAKQVRTAIDRSGLSAEKKDQLLEEFAMDSSKFERLGLIMRNTTNPDTLRSQVETIKKYWAEKQSRFDYYVGGVRSAYLQNLLDRLKRMHAKTAVLIERLADNEADVTEIAQQHETIADLLDQTERRLTAANSLFADIIADETGLNNKKELFENGMVELKNAHALLRETRSAFSALLGAIRVQLMTFDDSITDTSTPTNL